MVTQFIELIESANTAIHLYFCDYYGDRVFFIITAIAFVYLFVTCEELRYKFLLPIALMLVVIMNPILYHFVLSKVIYWRVFWMIPNVAIMAAAIIVLLNRQKRIWLKWCMLALVTVFVFCCGDNVFQNQVFTERQNWEKLYQDTIDVCDIMLEIDDTPRALVHSGIFTEIRQYAPEIELMYGRDAHFYIKTIQNPAYAVYCALSQEPKMYDYALEIAKTYGYNFIVIEASAPIAEELLVQFGYKEVEITREHIIYYNEEI